MITKHIHPNPTRFIASLIGLSIICLGLLYGRILVTDSYRYIFLFWNLFLAAIPALLAWWLVIRLQKVSWAKWQQVVITFLWLAFLPNSFYMITDFVHLRPNYEADLLFDVVLLSGFLLAGIALGFLSIYLVHSQLVKRIKSNQAIFLIGFILLLCSFAIYLGRFTRWNTWDILFRPAGLLYDVSERLINPAAYSQTYLTTATFFLVLFSLYLVIWEGLKLIRSK